MIRMDKHQAALIALLAATSLIAWRPLYETFLLSWQNDAYTYILLVLPISILLLFLQRESLRLARSWGFRSGLVLLIAAAAIICTLFLYPTPFSNDGKLAIEMMALVLSWNGAFLLCLGARAFRMAQFPLLFAFALVPLPKIILGFCIALLQWGSTWSTHVLFAAFGVPVLQHGFLLTIPGLTVEVAKECSSIRSSSMLVVTTMIMAHVLLRSPWRKMLAIVLAVPLSVAKNGLRIFTIAMLGTRVDPGYLNGKLHHQGGILFFILAIMIEFAIVLLLRKKENLPAAAPLEPCQDTVMTR